MAVYQDFSDLAEDPVRGEIAPRSTETFERAAPARVRAAPLPARLSPTPFQWAQRVLEFAIILSCGYITAIVVTGGDILEPADTYFRIALLGALLYIFLADRAGAFKGDATFSLRRGWQTVLSSWLSTAFLLTALGFVLQLSELSSREWILTWFASSGACLAFGRAGATLLLRSLKDRGQFNQRTAIFGTGPQADRFIRYVHDHNELMLDLVASFDDRGTDRRSPPDTGLPVRGNLQNLVRDIRAGEIDQVIIALPWSASNRLQSIVTELSLTPVDIRLAPEAAGFAFMRKPITLLGDLPVTTLLHRPIAGTDQAIKWLEDQAIAALLLFILAPLMLVIAVAIRLDSPGPIFFQQEREGFNNRRFRIWKFRTMRHNMCEAHDIRQARRADPRVTRVGAFLRKSSLDELPQLFNVIAGEMSIVGPRPHAPSTRAGTRVFEDVIATYAGRHRVKPGITGWAQVCGWRGPTETEYKLLRRVEHDLFYIDNWSVWLDMYVLIRTAFTLPFCKGAF
jgi:Undecaprenyl-phosphate glucose phosphotransferase